MDSEVLLDGDVVTRCRRRVHLDHDPTMIGTPTAPLDPGAEQRIADAAEYRRELAEWLGGTLGADWTEIPREASTEEREEETLAAMCAGAGYISGAQLPLDREGGRQGSVDLLVRSGGGYVPVLVVRHKVTDPGKGARTSPLTDPRPESARKDPTRKPRSQARDQLRLAHLVRLLQACGMHSAGRKFGGAIGSDADTVLWHDLEARTWSGGRSVLAEYDERFADRLAVAEAAASRNEALAQPTRVLECKACPWWPVCGEQLRTARDVSLVVRGDDAARLRGVGVNTVDELAEFSPENRSGRPLPANRMGDAVLLARAWLRDLPLVRRVPEVTTPRGDVEIDVDMESYADSGAYLWGTLLSYPRDEGGRSTDTAELLGFETGYRGFVTWDPLPSDDEARSFAEFWSWFTSVRRAARERGLTFRAYCYNELAENRWMLSSAERFAGKPGIPTVEEVRKFITSPEWVDVFAVVRDQFLCPNGKGLKVIAPSAGFAWRDAEAGGENSMRWYRDAVGFDGGQPQEKQRGRLLEYNEDDVRATLAIRRWITSGGVREIPYTGDL
ncbi:recombinase RecB [Actinopolyspora erythraea]|uniref:Recombinase RecB n=2 Tax=Actinopolyspora erythraea TaxID=414996 RepID=A0A223RMD7_9ACTN|nr:TM0106 family RecB-like putative nuclease [Actinopolyspora erythraea]ASU77040.1 recombinase RecB [Actinopolyspora erythraea]